MPPPCAFPGFDAVTPAGAARARTLVVLPLSVVGNGNAQTDFLSTRGDRRDSRQAVVDAPAPRDRRPAHRLRSRRSIPPLPQNEPAAELKTKYVLTGAVSSSREGARVAFALYDGAMGARAWTHNYLYDSVGAGPIVRGIHGDCYSHRGRSHAARIADARAASDAKPVGLRVAAQGRCRRRWRGVRSCSGCVPTSDSLDRGYLDAYSKLALADADLLNDGVEKSEGGVVLLEELQSAASRAVANNPTSALAWLAEGRARLLGGRATSAWRTAFDRAVALDGRNPTILESTASAGAHRRPRRGRRHVASRGGADSAQRRGADDARRDRDRRQKGRRGCGLLNTAIAADALYGPAWADRALLRMKHGELRFAWADAETATKVGSGLLGEGAAAIVDLASRDTARARSRLGDVMLDVSSRGTISVREGRAVASALIAAEQMTRALDVLEAVRPGPAIRRNAQGSKFRPGAREPRFRA